MNQKVRVFLFALVIIGCVSLVSGIAAGSPLQFTSPSQITLKVYYLNPNGSIHSSYTLCTYGDTQYGCTASSAYGGYPFTTNPVTVQLEGTATTNRYLRDVVTQEMGPAAHHPQAVRAQAVAARTYAYWHINSGSTINNSAGFQVFLPRKYDTLTASQKSVVDAAMQDRYYMSSDTNDSPIFSEFTADVPLRTIAGGHSALQSVADPISRDPAVVLDGHGHGMSQKGASRWMRGNLSFQGTLGPWPFAWENYKQVLMHYYTDVHLRDANNNNALVTPLRRDNLLHLGWSRPPQHTNGICSPLWVWVQNTGTETWAGADQGYYGQQIGIGYCWNNECTPAGYLPQSVQPGEDIQVRLALTPPAGAQTLSIDLYYKPHFQPTPTWFGVDWPRQMVGTFDSVKNCSKLPLVLKQS